MESVAFDGVDDIGLVENFCQQLSIYRDDENVGADIAERGRLICVETASANIRADGEMYKTDYKPRIDSTFGDIKCKYDVRNCLHGWRTDVLEDDE